jgi:hypothetical protein
LAHEVNTVGNYIMYGIAEPFVHARYLKAYGCVHWSDEALAVLRAHSPLVEIGAGAGHWQVGGLGRLGSVLYNCA